MSILFNLMRSAVDYAGLFPPASLPIAEVVANYSNYLKSAERAMLGRLIVPALSLEDFKLAAASLIPNDSVTPAWRISALLPPVEIQPGSLDTRKFDSAIEAIYTFNQHYHSNQNVGAVVDCIEVKTSSIEALNASVERLPTGISSFLEIPDLTNPTPMIAAIAQVPNEKKVFAKVRTGGVTPDLVPMARNVARFIRSCASHGVGFKATAGLHHPIRAQYRLTYQSDSPVSYLFGFLNVFVAAMIAFEHDVSEDVLEEILTTEDASRFGFDQNQLAWDDLAVKGDRVDSIREQGIVSFGSCSFVEPTTELHQLPNVSFESVFSN